HGLRLHQQPNATRTIPFLHSTLRSLEHNVHFPEAEQGNLTENITYSHKNTKKVMK
ncbi:hypothetical protein KI387_042624, partial [Taxus chinensis]